MWEFEVRRIQVERGCRLLLDLVVAGQTLEDLEVVPHRHDDGHRHPRLHGSVRQ